MTWRVRHLVGLGVAAYGLVQVPGLPDHPSVGGDEAWVGAMARAWRVEGRLRNLMLESVWPRALTVVRDAQWCNGWVVYVPALSLWTRVVGEGLRAERLFTWLCGTVAIALTVLVARQLGGPAAGLWAGGILATRYLFWETARMVRPDVPMALVWIGAFALWLRAAGGSWGAAAGCGALAGLAPGIHVNGLLLAPTLGMLAAWVGPDRRCGLSLLGGWCVATGWLASRLPLEAMAVGWAWAEGAVRTPRLFTAPWVALRDAVVEPFTLLAGRNIPVSREIWPTLVFEWAALYPALAVCWRAGGEGRRSPRRQFVVFVGLLFLASSCLIGAKRNVYLIYFYPLLAVGLGLLAVECRAWLAPLRTAARAWWPVPVGVAATWGLRAAPPAVVAGVWLLLAAGRLWRPARPRWSWAPVSCGIGLTAALGAGGAWGLGQAAADAVASRRSRPSYADLTEQVRAAIPDGARVFGPHMLWFALRDHPFADATAFEATGAWRVATLEQLVSRYRPEVIVSDDGLRGMFFQRHLPRANGMLTLRPELRVPHRLVARVPAGPPYGTLEVFWVRWPPGG